MLVSTIVIGTIITIIIAKNCPIVNLNYDLLYNSAIDFLGQESEKADLYVMYALHRVMDVGIRWGSEFSR